MPPANAEVDSLVRREYQHGFVTDLESDTVPPGLDEDVIRLISRKKEEPEFLVQWRLKAYRHWLTMTEPRWANVHHPPIDYDGISYYSSPKTKDDGPKSLDEVDPKLLETYEKLGVPLEERAALAGVAVDAVFDSVSVATTFKDKLAEQGILFCSFSEAVREHPELVEQYLGTVVPYTDNFFATLNSAVFSDGSFCYIPRGVRCPMELSTYFRINAAKTGQFERTLVVADEEATSATSRGARRRCATRTSSTPRWSSSSRWKGRRSSTRRCRTGTPATRTGSAASTTSSPSAETAGATVRRSPGPRWRPARPSPGSTRAASCAATTRSAHSTRSLSATCASRRIPARR